MKLLPKINEDLLPVKFKEKFLILTNWPILGTLILKLCNPMLLTKSAYQDRL